jgi:hypothetical protein
MSAWLAATSLATAAISFKTTASDTGIRALLGPRILPEEPTRPGPHAVNKRHH